MEALNEYLNHQNGIMRRRTLFLRMDKYKKMNLYQTVRRFITWKENTERISMKSIKNGKYKQNVFFCIDGNVA